MYLSKQEEYGRKLQTGHTFQQDIMKPVKCKSTKSKRRTGKFISKKAKLYCTTFFAFLVDNVVCKNQDINDKRIVDIQAIFRTILMFQSSFAIIQKPAF